MVCRTVFLALLCASSVAMAQDAPTPAARTSSVTDARFEVVQSPRAPSFTFRLDRHTGRVWQLTNVRGDFWEWEETPVPEQIPAPSPGRPRFQLHVSGISNSHSLLIDTETGKTWQFTKEGPTYQRERSRNGYGWEVVPDR